MKDTLQLLKNQFIEELVVDGDIWRILRKTTLVDIIIVEFNEFSRNHLDDHLKTSKQHSLEFY